MWDTGTFPKQLEEWFEEDVKLNDGKLEEFVRKDKTDMEAEGTTFTMVARGENLPDGVGP